MAQRVTPASVGQRIKMVRGDLTQKEFARALGIKKQNYVSRYEKGRIPTHDILVKIAEYGRVTVDWLLTGMKEGKELGFETRETPPPYGKSRVNREINELLKQLQPEDKKVLLRLLKGMLKSSLQ